MNFNFNVLNNKHKNSINFNIKTKTIFVPKNGEMLKIIDNTNNLYGITNYGKIISLTYNIVLKSNKDRGGYLYNCIRVNHKNIYIKPHRLVAKYFIDNPNNYKCVNHKDENKTNNHISNLEWCTHSYNNSYGNRLEKVSKTSGHQIDVYKNGIYYCTENSITACTKKYHVSFHTIYESLNNVIKKYRWYSSIYEFQYHKHDSVI